MAESPWEVWDQDDPTAKSASVPAAEDFDLVAAALEAEDAEVPGLIARMSAEQRTELSRRLDAMAEEKAREIQAPLVAVEVAHEERLAIQEEPPPLRVDVGPGWEEEQHALRPAPEVADLRGFETAEDFLRRIRSQPPMSWLVNELIPDEGIVVWHGRPRSMKSLCALEVVLALASGRPAFSNERFACPSGPQPVLYLSEEDSERLFAFRIELLQARQGETDVMPNLLRLRVRPGWNLETAAGQASLVDAIHRCAPEPRVLVIDPARGSLPSVDGGPKDGAVAIGFMRQILRETSIKTLILPHHDVKPNAQKEDQRVRAERASGGIVFSIADCPVSFERQDERTTLAVPSHYKVSGDPKPFEVTFESATGIGEPFEQYIRPVATTKDHADEAVRDRDRDRVIQELTRRPFQTTTELDEQLKFQKGTANRIVRYLERVQITSFDTGDLHGRRKSAQCWYIREGAKPLGLPEEE